MYLFVMASRRGEADFEALGGTFCIETANAPLLLALLPRMIHVRPPRGDRCGSAG
ncbi:hypothetical protein ACVIM7_002425 [Bradyrhizobium liaoningense]